MIQQLGEFSEKCGMRQSDRVRFEMLAEELITNAIWNAPIDQTKSPKYAASDRRKPVVLLPEERVLVQYASDGYHLGISVTDHFGRLDSDVAFRYLLKNASPGGPVPDEKAGGAGLGLVMALGVASSLIINVNPGFRTEVAGLVRLRRMKDPNGNLALQNARSFSFFRS